MSGSEKNRQGKSLFWAVLIGPLSIIPVAVLLQSFWFLIYIPSDLSEVLGIYAGGLIVAVAGLIYAYGFALLYCLPVYIWLRKYGLHSRCNMVLSGLLLALLLFLPLWNQSSLLFLVGVGVYSAVVAVAFQFIAARKEKDAMVHGCGRHKNK